MDELIKQIEGGYRPEYRTIKANLIRKYGDDVLITTTHKKVPIVCFKNTGYKILTDSWYKQKCSSAQEERRRIVETAAAIIAEDIRPQVFEKDHYPPADHFLEKREALIPGNIALFYRHINIETEAWRYKQMEKEMHCNCSLHDHCCKTKIIYIANSSRISSFPL